MNDQAIGGNAQHTAENMGTRKFKRWNYIPKRQKAENIPAPLRQFGSEVFRVADGTTYLTGAGKGDRNIRLLDTPGQSRAEKKRYLRAQRKQRQSSKAAAQVAKEETASV